MKPLFLLTLLCALNTVFATDYYFSSTTGDDNRSSAAAQNPSTPWRSLDKLNAIFAGLQPGDAVYLKRGDIFYGSIVASRSGAASQPITIGAYGNGSKPVITGLVSFSNWVPLGNNIWSSYNPSLGSSVNTVLLNEVAQQMGRYPNSDAPNKGYLTLESFSSNASITDNELASFPNWTGGEVVIRKRLAIIDRSTISAHSGNTLSYYGSAYPVAGNGFGYFIQNHLGTLDQHGEWYYNAAQKVIYMYFNNNNPYAYDVKASTLDNLVSGTYQSNIVYNNLTIKGANKYGFFLQIGNNVQVNGCDILFSGEDGIKVAEHSNLKIENSTISNSNNNGIHLQYGNSNAVIRNNKIENTQIFAGMGQNSDGNGVGISAAGEGNLIEYNQVLNTGFNGVYYFGNNVIIKNNLIDNFCLQKSDGGGIYTYTGDANTSFYGRKITGNIVLNAVGAPHGTPEPYARAEGISLDDNSSGVEITDNTVANCNSYGMFFTNSRNILVKNNTFYNNSIQLFMTQYRSHTANNGVMVNNEISNNIFFSKTPNQLAASLKSVADDLASFGSFDNNYYVRPLNDATVIYNAYVDANGKSTSNAYNVNDWKLRYGKDPASQGSPVQIPAYTLNATTGTNKFLNPSFTSNTDWVYGWSAAGNSVVSWGNGLDGGSFQLSFGPSSGTSNSTVVNSRVGALEGGKTYLLKFSLLGSNNNNSSLAVYLRQTASPYDKVSDVKYVKIAATRTENEMVFTVPAAINDATLIFETNDQSMNYWLDNIELAEANVTFSNPDDYFLFEYNASSASKTVAIPGDYVDARNNRYSNSITLAPYSSVVLIKNNGATVAPPPPPPPPTPPSTCSATGTILREYWNNIQGTDVAAIPLQTNPSGNSQLTALETSNSGQNTYGARISGYICPPLTGNYVFSIAGDDGVELWLSTDDNPSNKVRIAGYSGWTTFREWNKYSSQNSAPISLQAGKRYYIEVLHKQGWGGDHVSVAWKLPDGTTEAPIPGSRLSPNAASTIPAIASCSATGTILREQWNSVQGTDVNSIPLLTRPASIAQLTVLETSTSGQSTYGARISGYICAPENGNYVFTIAGDDGVELWLSTDDNPSNKVRIAGYSGWTTFREWNKYSSQNSAPISLQAGKRYYIEVLHKQGWGGDHVSVAWQLPNGTREAPIPGSRLSPYVPSTTPNISSCTATGTILREQWNSVQGTDVKSIPLQTNPSGSTQLTVLETTTSGQYIYGARIRGYICPPLSGHYTFRIAGDDGVELWLSTDDDPANKVLVAGNAGWTAFRDYWANFSQKSAPVNLEAGKRYYIEVLHKQGWGGDHVSVAWQLPDGTTESPIPGSRLSPYQPSAGSSSITSNISPTNAALSKPDSDLNAEAKLVAYPNPFRSVTTLQVYPEESGLATLEVFDLTGSSVQRIFSGHVEAGRPRSFSFKASGLSDGIYIVRLKTKTKTLSQKIILAN